MLHDCGRLLDEEDGVAHGDPPPNPGATKGPRAKRTPRAAHHSHSPLAQAAGRLAMDLLADDAARWQHTCAVTTRAAEAAGTLAPEQRPVLVAAAWLHDIGYSPRVGDYLQHHRAHARTGYHPLDGATYLRLHH